MGVGQEGTANYMMVPGNWSYWLWLGSLVPPDLSLQCAAFGDTNATCVDVPAPAMGHAHTCVCTAPKYVLVGSTCVNRFAHDLRPWVWTDAAQLNASQGNTPTPNQTWPNLGESGVDVECTGTVQEAGLNGLRTVLLPTSQYWYIGLEEGITDYTLFFVGRPTGEPYGRVLQSPRANQLYGYWGGRKKVFFTEGNPSLLDGNSIDTMWAYFSISKYFGGDYVMRWDGEPLYQGCCSEWNYMHGLMINYPWGIIGEHTNTEMAELLLYNRVLNPQDVYEVESYIASKWGLSPPR